MVAGAAPLVACRPAPFTDWPNHIARVFIGVRLLLGDPFWGRFYTLNPVPVPNEALDLGIGALNLAGLSVDTAATIFLLSSYAIFVTGFVRLARAYRADGPEKPLLGAALFLTGPLMYGLVNYMLGLGVAMWLVGAWHAGGPRRRWFLAIFATPLLFLVHLMGAAIWVLLILCLEAPVWIAERRRGARHLARCASGLGAGIVLAGLVLASPVGADSLPRADGSNIWYMGNESWLHVLRWKALTVPRMFSDHASLPVAVITMVAIGMIVACIGLGGRARLRLGAALACAALIALVLVLPESAGTGSLLDYRICLVPIVVAAAAIEVNWRRPFWRRTAFALIAGVLLARGVTFSVAFAAEQAVFTDFDAFARSLPAGGLLLAARGRDDADIPDREWWSPPLEHIGSRAVYASIFVPTVFAVASQQPVVLRPEFTAWRRSWRVASPAEFDAMRQDIAPLCATRPSHDAKVYLFVAYSGDYVSKSVPRRAIVIRADKYEVIDICRWTPDVGTDDAAASVPREPAVGVP